MKKTKMLHVIILDIHARQCITSRIWKLPGLALTSLKAAVSGIFSIEEKETRRLFIIGFLYLFIMSWTSATGIFILSSHELTLRILLSCLLSTHTNGLSFVQILEMPKRIPQEIARSTESFSHKPWPCQSSFILVTNGYSLNRKEMVKESYCLDWYSEISDEKMNDSKKDAEKSEESISWKMSKCPRKIVTN